MASSVAAGTVRPAIISAGERPQLVHLHLGVLELAQAVLQRLQLPDRLPVRARVVQRTEDLQHVAQLLAALAQVVQGLRGGRRGDGGAVGEHPRCALRIRWRPGCGRWGAPGGGVRPRGLRASRGIAGRIWLTEAACQLPLRRGALAREMLAEGLQVGG